MYSRAETAKIRKDFWTAFGQYMKPVPNADGLKVNWQNYKTGVRQIFFRMKAERGFASIGIELNHKDEEMQELVFGQFQEFKRLLEAEQQEEWDWELHAFDESGNVVSRIQTVLNKVNVMDKNDWPAIISFLKPRIIALDAFWSNIKPAFEDL
ncbi:DUF4268 domain-containing protein [Arthrospiribacter ruber]|uniref:DUF4268 domain-containing protein n=1 Tax=Arthrospiribacter ruber TaxID=2487934 RepID=A0A951IYS8_9BACT|nr:DUF4268 domain-containing protein [Arthrospiribacter ruber]MBW3469680.1 DUF4268 domain-containing protein [Arthrospiribacter ruber]